MILLYQELQKTAACRSPWVYLQAAAIGGERIIYISPFGLGKARLDTNKHDRVNDTRLVLRSIY